MILRMFGTVLYLPIYEQGHDIQKQQKHGLRDALARYGMVYEIDWQTVSHEHGSQYLRSYLLDALDFWKPDVLLTQIHTPDPALFNAHFVRDVRKEYPEVLWVNWNGDYHPEDLLSQASMDMVRQFDAQCVVTTAVRDA